MNYLCLMIASTGGLFLSLPAPSLAAPNAAACEARYETAQTNPHFKSPQKRARYMEHSEPRCTGTGMFDVWIAADYLTAGDAANAVRVAERAIQKTASARPNLLHVLVRVDLSRGSVDQAVKRAEALAIAYPKYIPIQFELAGIATKCQDWPRALDHARKAYEIEGSALSLLSMASALHQLDRHEETVAAVRRALELEPQRVANIGGVGEAIFSLAILNRRPEAVDLARRHVAANPNWRANPLFARAAAELGVAR